MTFPEGLTPAGIFLFGLIVGVLGTFTLLWVALELWACGEAAARRWRP